MGNETASHTGIMVAFFVPLETASQLALPDGKPSGDLHCTLSFLGDTSDFTGDVNVLKQTLSSFASQYSPLHGNVSGIGRFTPENADVHPVYASVNVEGLQELRASLVDTLTQANMPVDTTYTSYTPHITLAYVPADAPNPVDSVEQYPLDFDSLWLAFGDERTRFPFCEDARMESLTVKQRAAIPDDDYAWPDAPDGPKYPCDTQAHLDACAKLLGDAPQDKQDAIKARAITIAKRHGFTLPHSWQDNKEEDAHEQVQESASTPPRAKLATLKVRWLSDDAISLNGRQYPESAVNRLIQSAQMQLSNPTALPLTCYVSHGMADMDNNTKLIGRITSVWREGRDALATIDIADTHAGRDIVALVANKYLTPVSLRAINAEMTLDRKRGIPQVGGDSLTLQGVDFTATPGLPGVGTVQDVQVFESATPVTLTEVFDFDDASTTTTVLLETQESTPMDENEKLVEGAQSVEPMTSGVTQGTDNAPQQSDYAKRTEITPGTAHIATPTGEVSPPSVHGVVDTERANTMHDHVASVLGMSCAPHSQEAGRKINAADEARLGKVHDMCAEATGKGCTFAAHKAAQQSAQEETHVKPTTSTTKENKPMSLEEAKALLEQSGFSVQAPKTEVEKLKEEFEAQIAQLKESMKQQTTNTQPAPQRRSLVEGANVQTEQQTARPKAKVYRHGDYLRNQMKDMSWEELADRTAPVKEGLAVERLLKEFGQVFVVQSLDRMGFLPENETIVNA